MQHVPNAEAIINTPIILKEQSSFANPAFIPASSGNVTPLTP